MTTLYGKVTYDNFPWNRGKLFNHIQLHEKWYPNLIEQKYKFTLVRYNGRKYNFL